MPTNYVELYNRGSGGRGLSTWSVQYASSTGSRGKKTSLTGTIQPGHYYLIQEASGSSGSLCHTGCLGLD